MSMNLYMNNIIVKKVISLIETSVLNKGDIFNVYDEFKIENNTYYKIFISGNKPQYLFVNSDDFTTIEKWRENRLIKIFKS